MIQPKDQFPDPFVSTELIPHHGPVNIPIPTPMCPLEPIEATDPPVLEDHELTPVDSCGNNKPFHVKSSKIHITVNRSSLLTVITIHH